MTLHDPTHLFKGEVGPTASKWARAISIITHPPFLSAFMFVLLSLTGPDALTIVLTAAVCILTATIVPTVAVFHYSKVFGNTDGDVYRREDRMKPLAIGIASYIIGVILLAVAGAPRVCTVMMISYAVSTVIVLLISTRWKISIHATGVMGPAMALSYVYPPWGYLMYLLIPITAWSRYVRHKHTPAQLIGGFVYGFVITGIFLYIVL